MSGGENKLSFVYVETHPSSALYWYVYTIWSLCNFYYGINSIIKLKVYVKGSIIVSAGVGSFICMLLVWELYMDRASE